MSRRPASRRLLHTRSIASKPIRVSATTFSVAIASSSPNDVARDHALGGFRHARLGLLVQAASLLLGGGTVFGHRYSLCPMRH